MNNKNVIFNHTLEQYNKKYRNRKFRLLKITKKEVEDFDKKNHRNDKVLLRDKKWWLIKDTYYEIPKPIRFTWFRNLNAATQASICLLGAGILATAITVPTVLLNQTQEYKIPEIEINEEVKSLIDIKDKKFVGDNLEMTLSIKDDKKEFTGEIKVTIGKNVLEENKEYSFNKDNGKLSIKKTIIESNKGQSIIIEPKLKDKTPVVTSFNIDWATKKVDGTNTLYELAKTSTKIVVGTNKEYKTIAEALDNVQIYNAEESDQTPGSIKAYYGKNADQEFELYVLSDGKIVFEDNDKFFDGQNYNGFFTYCSLAKELILPNIDTRKVTELNICFYGCSNVINLDLSSFDTSNVTDMYYIFGACKKLTSINISSFNTSKVKNLAYMFFECEELVSLDLSHFDTSNCVYMEHMFSGCYKLSSLNISSFNTKKVIDMKCMFLSCKSLTSLDISNFDTSKVLDMYEMFKDCCKLTSLDLSSFDTSKVYYMYSLFEMSDENNTELKTIYVSDKFVTTGVPTGYGKDMFKGCKKLVGGAGTTYNSNKTDVEYARMDNGSTSSKPGYFTDYKEKPISDAWFTFNPIKDGAGTTTIAYSIKLTNTGLGAIPTNFVLPSTHKEPEDAYALPVTQVESNAFTSIDNPVSLLAIPSNITSIGANSFDSTFIDINTDIRFKDSSATWSITDGETTISKFNPASAQKSDVIKYLNGNYTWTKEETVIEGALGYYNYGTYGCYMYYLSEAIAPNTKFKLTATIEDSHLIYDFSAGYNSTSYNILYKKSVGADVNVTKLSKQASTGGVPEELEENKDFTVTNKYGTQTYDYHWIDLSPSYSSFNNGDKLIVECTVVNELSNGVMFYCYSS